MDSKLTRLEKFLIGSSLTENLSTTALALTTNLDEKYLTALISTSVVSAIAAGVSLSYRFLSSFNYDEGLN